MKIESPPFFPYFIDGQKGLLHFPPKGDISRLLRVYEQNPNTTQGELLPLVVNDVDAHGHLYDVYNSSAPFMDSGIARMAARTEPRYAEHNTKTRFFRSEIRSGKNIWVEDSEMPTFSFQDPTVTKIGDELVLGGVKTYPLADNGTGYKMEFYKGPTLKGLQKFAEGPDNMKGIRLVELPQEKVGVFTRPQETVNGVDYGKGQICYTEIDALDQLSLPIIAQAEQIGLRFTNGEWGGPNEAHVLHDGQLGVLFHIARLDKKGGKHYYAGVFTMDRKTRKIKGMRLIATKDDFPDAPNKRPDTEDIIYPCSIKNNGDGTFDFYAGLRDTSVGKIRIPNPFTPESELPQAA